MISTIIRIAVSAIVLTVCAVFIDFSKYHALLNPKILLVIITFSPLFAIAIFFLALRLSLLIKSRPLKLFVVYKSIVLMQFINLFTPARTSELVKPLYIYSKSKVNSNNVIMSCVADRMLDLIAFYFIVILFIQTSMINMRIKEIIYPLAALPVLFILFYAFSRTFLFRKEPKNKLMKWLRESAEILIDISKSKEFYLGLLLTGVSWIFTYLALFLIINTMGSININPVQAITVFAFMLTGAALPGLPGGFGAFEAGIMLALKIYGYTPEEGLLIGLVVHVSQLTIPVVLSLLILFIEKLSIKDFINKSKMSTEGY